MSRSRRGPVGSIRIVSLLILVSCFAVSALGQTFGEVTGRVTDPSGAAVPGATLTLTNTATNAARTTASTNDGFYDFPSVPPGSYNVKAEHTGFKLSTSTVEVQVQQTVRLEFALEVGQISQSVEVSAAANLLQADNATVGSVISNQSIAELPLNGREYLNLVALSSNVNTLSPNAGQAMSRQGGDRASQAISTGGNRIFFNYYTLDGVNNTDFDFNTYVVLPSIDAIQEFKVQTGVYPAEFGHGASQVNVLTKSGGNAYHASLFEFNRNVDYDALPYQFTANKPAAAFYNWNDYGFELDGPVRIPKLFDGRNKLFFMANWETLTVRNTSQSIYSVPTAAMQQGNYSAYPTTIYDPTSKAPFANNTIPTSMLDPFSQKFLKYYAQPNLPGLTNNYTQNNSSPFNRDMFVVRMDYVESAKSQWSGRYSWCSEVQSFTGLSITGGKTTTGCEQYMGDNTRILSPNVVNEAHFGHTRIFNAVSRRSAFTTNVVGALGIPNLNPGAPVQWGVPGNAFNSDGFSYLGDDNDTPYSIGDNDTQLVDNVSWIKGKHTFKFGFEYERDNFDSQGNQFLRGNFTYSPNSTATAAGKGGDAFADFLLGDIYQSTVAFQNAVLNDYRNDFAVFADDTWKITPKLTLTLGMRWELIPPFTNSIGNLFNIVQPLIVQASNAPAAQQPYFIRQGNCQNAYTANPPIPFTWGQTPAVCSNGLENDQLNKVRNNDFAPRIAIAYSPDSKTVIRAAFGTFFVQDNGNSMYFDMARNLGVRLTLTATTYGNTWSQGSGIQSGKPDTFVNAVTPPGAGGAGPAFPPPYGFGSDYNHFTSYTEQYLLNIQRQVGTNWSFEIGFLGSESHHLYGFQNTNEAPPGTTNVITRLPFADFGVIQWVANGMNASYNSLAFKATRRFNSGLSVISNYTWSKSLDDSSGIRVQGYDELFPQNSYCLECDRGLSSFDVGQRWVTSVLYELPIGKGKPLNINNGFLNAVVGGWQAGGTFTLQSGLPQVLTIGGKDNSGTNEGADRPQYVGGSIYANNQSASDWLNRSAFAIAPAGQFGNFGRNVAITPAIGNLDAELHKSFIMPFNEHHMLTLRFEGFNVLNHPAFGAPSGNILAGAANPADPSGAHLGFGVISGLLGTIPMRQLQLGAKYTF